jgi:ankyrin repeat protein
LGLPKATVSTDAVVGEHSKHRKPLKLGDRLAPITHIPITAAAASEAENAPDPVPRESLLRVGHFALKRPLALKSNMNEPMPTIDPIVDAKEKESAAVKIQALARGRITRKSSICMVKSPKSAEELKEQEELMKMLIERQASERQKLAEEGRREAAAIKLQALSRGRQVRKIYSPKSAAPSTAISSGDSEEITVSSEACSFCVDSDGYHASHNAAYYGHTSCLTYLIDSGCDYWSASSIDGQTPLHFACCTGNSECTTLLLNKGVDWSVLDYDGRTAIISAVLSNDVATVNAIVQFAYSWINQPDYNGNSALHASCFSGNTEITKILIHYGADHSLCSNTYVTPAHLTTSLGCLQELIQAGADVFCVDEYGRTPLHYFASSDLADLVQFMLIYDEKKYLVNHADIFGETPLHMSASCGGIIATRLLLEYGAIATVKNSNHKTPVNLSELYGHSEIAFMIDDFIAAREDADQKQE